MLLESIWNGSINVSVGSGVSKGVIMLLTKDLSTVAFKADLEGRYLITTINLGHNYYIHTMNVYAPNNHVISKQFFKCSFEAWDSYLNAQSALLPLNHLSSSIIAGDFNCVINNHDFQNRSWTAKEKDLANTIQTKMEERMLYNTVLRSSYGNNFTWNRGNTFSKIDHVYCSIDLLNIIAKYNTEWDFVKTDHAAICLTLKGNSQTVRGRSYVKLNASDLKNVGDREAIKEEIIRAISEFPMHWNPHQKLDYIKMTIRTKTL